MPSYYDRIAHVYDKRWRRYSELTYRMVLDALPESFTGVLDFGCGTGRLLELIAEGRSVQISGIDASQAMLEVARRRLGGAAHLYHGSDLTAVSAETFDVILLVNSAHYVSKADMQKLLSDARSHLKPGGKLVVVDFDPRSRAVRYGRPLLKIVDEGMRHVYEQSEFEQLLQEAGFTTEIKQQRPLGFWWHGWLLRAQAA